MFTGGTGFNPEDPVEALVLAWNTAIAGHPPLLPWQTLTTDRRRLIRAALVVRPIEAWRAVFSRVVRSRFLGGLGPRAFVASLDWLLGPSDAVVQLLEGRYDDPAAVPVATFERPPLECAHLPACPHPGNWQCQQRTALEAQKALVPA